jgi:CubicO group peptidase (beta-lactamase class C family)
MKPVFVILFSCLLLNTIAQKTAPADKRFDGLDAAFEKVLTDWKAAGFAVAVVEKNKIIYSKGFGYRDLEKKLPVTPHTLFAIGSCTKAFTSSLIGLLQKEGKVEFDKPAHTYLNTLRFYNDEMNNGITLRDMMSHRTGLPR